MRTVKKIFYFFMTTLSIYVIALTIPIILNLISDSNKTTEDLERIRTVINHSADSANKETNADFKSNEKKIFALKNLNPDTVAYLKVRNTNIDYPVVQTEDNDFYLYNSFQKKENGNGWTFMDYRNSPADKNIVIYGHSCLDKTMFGTLKKTLEKKWLSDTSNYFVEFETENSDTLWEVFSVYTIPVETYYIKINFEDPQEFKNWIDEMKKRSVHNFNVDLDEKDRVLTLSTCYTSDAKIRLVLQAKQITINEQN
ncbi:MAG: class B sortase [Oscillospiraceae bacterium]|jgi:sortase B|nr:class B sortase [Oscillospiraceae bacterium]